MSTPVPGELYRHYKGGKYLVIAVSRNSDYPQDRSKKIVIYKQVYRGKNYPEEETWHRSLEEFCGYKTFQKNMNYKNKKFKAGEKVKRFTLLGTIQ
ncbi:MAG: DUF1653 domain-containing protein [Nanoarchaeota archaeon]|nr:DUF1653 domain-containing protein [Nanoarchaeota archaeon]MBU1027806.1 DUF1653 domain-containing protein [Nanoarchaeota archaeon]